MHESNSIGDSSNDDHKFATVRGSESKASEAICCRLFAVSFGRLKFDANKMVSVSRSSNKRKQRDVNLYIETHFENYFWKLAFHDSNLCYL